MAGTGQRDGLVVAGNTIPPITLSSVIKNWSGACLGFPGGNVLVGDHAAVLGQRCVLIPPGEDRGTLFETLTDPAPLSVRSAGPDW